MGYKSCFLDNQTYSASDVNAVLSGITTAGVVINEATNALNALNEAASEITDAGVVNEADNCRVIKSGDVYKINEGMCFMEDGSSIIFDAEGFEITPINRTYSYVYLKRNTTTNSIDICVDSEPGIEPFVPLCEIDELGNIYDRRKYARAKVQTNGAGTMREFVFEVDTRNGVYTLDVGSGNFTYLGAHHCKMQGYPTYVPVGQNLFDISDNTELIVSFSKNRFDGEYARFSFKKDGQNILISRILGSNAIYEMNLFVI